MATAPGKAITVHADADRFGRQRSVFGVMPFTVKVSSSDSGGGLFVLEQHNSHLGGPPRHFHEMQDEWFYVISGRYAIEVDGTRQILGPGASLLAPRGVPHVWALLADAPGRMLVAFTPAGDMEAFFDEASLLTGPTLPEQMSALFARHGMRVTGPPLQPDPDGGKAEGTSP